MSTRAKVAHLRNQCLNNFSAFSQTSREHWPHDGAVSMAPAGVDGLSRSARSVPGARASRDRSQALGLLPDCAIVCAIGPTARSVPGARAANSDRRCPERGFGASARPSAGSWWPCRARFLGRAARSGAVLPTTDARVHPKGLASGCTPARLGVRPVCVQAGGSAPCLLWAACLPGGRPRRRSRLTMTRAVPSPALTLLRS